METNTTQYLSPLKQFHTIKDSLLEGLLIVDFNWHPIYVNNAFCQQIQTPREELMGQSVKDKLPNIEKTVIFKMLEECMLNRNIKHFENEFTFNDASKKWFEIVIKPVEEGICVLALDITQHKTTEQKDQKISRLYAFISQVNQNIVRIKDEKALFRNSCQIAVAFGKFKIAWIGCYEEKTKQVSLVEQAGIISKDIEQIYLIENDYTQKMVMETGEYFVCNDILNNVELINWKPFVRDHAIGSCIILPIKKSDKIIGTFNLYSSDLAYFDEEEIKLMVEIAGDISFAIERFEKAKQHKQNEEIILHNEKRFRGLIENGNDVIALCNKKGKFIYGSPNFTKTLGYSMDEYLKLSVLAFMHPQSVEELSEKINQILVTPGASFNTQQRIKHNNGEWIWCEGKVTNMMHLEGVNAIVINFRNISEKKKTEQKLQKSEAFSRNIINSLSAHIAVIDKNGKIEAINDTWTRFATENSQTTLENTRLGSNYFKVCEKSAKAGDETAANVLIGLKKVMTKTERSFYFEYPCHSPITERWFAMLAMPFDGDEELVVIAHQDISQRKQAEDKLLQKNEELQKINFELDRFVYSVSHDLRSPLTSVLGLLSFIQEDTKEAETLAHILMIRDSINHLDEFIKNILSYSRNNRMELQIEKIPLEESINKIVNSLHHIKEAGKITFEININETCDFYSDKQSFSTIIENILSNAIKFQDKNKPNQFIKIKGTSKDDYLKLEISDNGIGIAPENYTKIFEMFARISGDVNGSGIGLYIVKEIVTKAKGAITIQSTLGKETTFKIKLKNLKPC